MIEILSEHAVVLLLCWGMACVGAAVVQQRPAGLLAWNRAFIIGLTASSTMLFPLTLLFPHRALMATLVCMGAAAAYWLTGLRAGSGTELSAAPLPARDVYERAAIAVIVIFVVVFGVINACFPLAWDGLQIWATKGLVLLHQGALTPELWPPSPNTDISRAVKYPPMVPLWTALLALVRGEFSWAGTKALFLPFYVSMLISIFDLSQRLLSRRLAFAAVLVSALIPVEFDVTTAGGYADMPLAAVLAAALAAMLRPGPGARAFRSPVLWTLAGLLMVKNEGVILLAITVMVAAVVLGKRVLQFWKPALGLGVAFALRVAYLWWTDAVDITFGYNLGRAYHRIAELPGVELPLLIHWDDWALYWPAVLVACVILLVLGRTVERALAAGLALAIAAYSGLYLFTNWEMALHISNSYTRLLQDFIPVASVTLAAAYGRMSGTGADGVADESPRQTALSADSPQSGSGSFMHSWLSSRVLVLIAGAFLLILLAGYFFKRAAQAPPPSSLATPTLTIPAGQPVAGFLDQVDNQTVLTVTADGNVVVSGWAGCANAASPLVKVEVLVDRQPVATAALSLPRPDVATAFGRPDFDHSGWTASFAAQGLGPGAHPITALATCSDGQAGTLPPFRLVVRGK